MLPAQERAFRAATHAAAEGRDTVQLILYQFFPNPGRQRAIPLVSRCSLCYIIRDKMTKRTNMAPARPAPTQLLLFTEAASLVRIRPALNEWRYYRMEIWPDLFGRALLVRQWGRIGTEGHRRLDPHPDPVAAINALSKILRAKRRRGYQDRTW
jgi:predicted DNA-binding WGR domain protein